MPVHPSIVPPPVESVGWLSRMLGRLGTPLQWSDIDKVMFLGVLTFVLRCLHLISIEYLARGSTWDANLSRSWLRTYELTLITTNVVWFTLLLSGMFLRRTRGLHTVFVHAMLQFFWVSNACLGQFLGIDQAPFWVTFVGAGVFSLLMFGSMRTYVGIASALLVTCVWFVLERTGVIPFAPLLLTRPLRPDGHPVTSWLVSVTVSSAILSVGVLYLTQYVIAQWQVHARKLETLSRTDELTGLTNRRRFLEMAERELFRARETARVFSVVLCDVDHFKLVNDQHGHEAGDACLVAVADALRRSVRGGDMVARYGGEEFVCLLPAADRDEARDVAESCRRGVAELRVGVPGKVLTLSVTAGVATFQTSTHNLDALLRTADDALYRGKAQGRNRVVCAEG